MRAATTTASERRAAHVREAVAAETIDESWMPPWPRASARMPTAVAAEEVADAPSARCRVGRGASSPVAVREAARRVSSSRSSPPEVLRVPSAMIGYNEEKSKTKTQKISFKKSPTTPLIFFGFLHTPEGV